MPGKSGHAKGKHSSRSKRSRNIWRERQHSPAITTQQQTTTPANEPAPALTVPAPSTVVSMPVTKPSSQYPHIGIELRRIGILTGIILVILIVLALLFS